MFEKQPELEQTKNLRDHPFEFAFPCFSFASLTSSFILQHSLVPISTDALEVADIQPQFLEINFGSFVRPASTIYFPRVEVSHIGQTLVLSCGCRTPKKKLCEHQAQVLLLLMTCPEIRAFFDEDLRNQKFRQTAIAYGLENEKNLHDFFDLEYAAKELSVKPRLKELLPAEKLNQAYLKERLLPQQSSQLPAAMKKERLQQVVILSQHKFYSHLCLELFEAQTTLDGKLKNPLVAVDALDLLWETDKSEELKFFTGISKFHKNYNTGRPASDLVALKAILQNPLQLPFYCHNPAVSANITAASVVPASVSLLPINLRLAVKVTGQFYEVTGQLEVNDYSYDLEKLQLQYTYFVQLQGMLYLIDNLDFLRIMEFFKQHNNKLLLHRSKFEEFRKKILAELENRVHISYAYLKPATPTQLEQQGFNQELEKIIYLSDSENFVLLTPVVRYGQVEIPVLSKKQIYATDALGNAFLVERDVEVELKLTAALLLQHPDFKSQLHRDHFSLHKKEFLEEAWFLEAFEAWRNQNITILGFNQITKNKLNPNKPKISIIVTSGVDWFDTSIDVRYGKQQVTIKHLYKAIRNRSKYVQLGDGTLGILPEEWLQKLAGYFKAGEVVEEQLRTPKINFSGIAALYEQELLTNEVKEELALYRAKFTNFETIKEVAVPPELQATLREYQKQGLNWLNFLDEMNFGGCLADDMGLGKTLQIISFILSQRQKRQHNTNLVVVPTSLIFNWQAEVEKFAPTLRLLTVYGAGRTTNTDEFDQYEIILTSYGTLLSDIRFLKHYRFNYIFLDESQNIKNPDSQRFKAARLLQSRNKVVLTGTPVENNTFDVYGQFAFACPGLLGTKQHFKEHYSSPIDKFKDGKRALELQKKIAPFMLRRTKQQVASELPEKTEMVIYCEMGEEQRRIYDACERDVRDFLLNLQEENLPKTSMQLLQGLTKLRQICNSPALLPGELDYGQASSKLDTLLEQLETKASDHKIVVFSQFVGMLNLIAKALEAKGMAYEYLSGKTRNRAAVVESFQGNSAVRVFLISLKAGGTGLNLTEADYVYLVDPWWNPAVENQAIDRTYRIGQKKNVVAVRLICPDTIEDKIRKLQESKKQLVQDLVKTDSSIFKSLTKKDLLGLLG
ncbi:ATP-dependent helicase [Pontibacter qinzhouensis]|uniref:ATP-dependent helicase n=1 Tax=Pontibacter qinzhouensis TaxID=2603253 RepID=A0A5C8K906_9BACT|nr:SNF2-related protein [Pontibacter qinzhouensis]TXK50523.1 ATP-dependent helicase [Pontibacter qinzhouensis]